jgi:hypothetical protein
MEITWADIGRVLLESTILVGFLQLVAGPALLERVKSSLSRELEGFRQELGLARATFDQHLGLLLDYYNRIYEHYRICQRAVSWDQIVHPERGSVKTKEEYLRRIDSFKEQWNADEGKIRLLLPKRLLESHEAVLSAINRFTVAVKRYSEADSATKLPVEAAFHPLHEALRALEEGLREFLRTERLLV